MPRTPDQIPDDWLRLLTAPGVGAATAASLLAHFEDAPAVVRAGARQLAQVRGLGPERAARIARSLSEADPDTERRIMAARSAALILRGDADYPALLAAIPDPPAALRIRGRADCLNRLAIAVVGARRCTTYGRDQAGRLSSLLAQSGLSIVSGGAVGIDAEAHRAALRVGGRTVAVLGCGLATCYPREHERLFERIVESAGALISEHPMRAPPRPGHFPHRNRIISGLSVGVLVVEAARRSGALVTARHAAEDHGREVMAVPGRVDSPASAGCLQAVREGWAALVTSHADVLAQLDGASHLVRGALEAAGVEAGRPSLVGDSLTAAQQGILDALGRERSSIRPEAIASMVELPLSRVLSELTLLEIRALVRRDADGGVRLAAGPRPSTGGAHR